MGGVSFAPVQGFSKYIVSSDGRIFGPRRELKSSTSVHGYERVSMIRDDGAKVNKAVHRVVLESFAGAAPAGTQCAHLDGTRSHNALHNLTWATPAENSAHKVRHGTVRRGEQNGNAVLTERQATDIRAASLGGTSVSELARRFNVDRRTVRLIRDGRTWQHVQ